MLLCSNNNPRALSLATCGRQRGNGCGNGNFYDDYCERESGVLTLVCVCVCVYMPWTDSKRYVIIIKNCWRMRLPRSQPKITSARFEYISKIYFPVYRDVWNGTVNWWDISRLMLAACLHLITGRNWYTLHVSKWYCLGSHCIRTSMLTTYIYVWLINLYMSPCRHRKRLSDFSLSTARFGDNEQLILFSRGS